jgi:hypothetical protein
MVAPLSDGLAVPPAHRLRNLDTRGGSPRPQELSSGRGADATFGDTRPRPTRPDAQGVQAAARAAARAAAYLSLSIRARLGPFSAPGPARTPHSLAARELWIKAARPMLGPAIGRPSGASETIPAKPPEQVTGTARLRATAVTGGTGCVMGRHRPLPKRPFTPHRKPLCTSRIANGTRTAAHRFFGRKVLYGDRAVSRERSPACRTSCAIAPPAAVDQCHPDRRTGFRIIVLRYLRYLQCRVPLAAVWVRPADLESRWICQS